MDAARLQQIQDLYHAALDHAPSERGAFLSEACGLDEKLRREVESLLTQNGSSDGPMDRPAISLLAEAMVAQVSAGDLFGPYRIESLLGAGGMGQVYKARDTRLGRAVAVKISSQQFSERFEREARTISSLNHPNICTLHDVGPNYLVMELVEGPTLAERIKRGPIALEEALRIAKQIADALEAAHEKGIVHRDLKPANIKIRLDGSVKVLDFGLAKAVGQQAEFTSHSPTVLSESGLILGTAGYMSPEQARGQKVDRRADIWAFGVVLYEMVSGRRLFERATLSDTLAAVIKEEPDWTRVPVKILRLLRLCLEKDANHRLRDISGVELLLGIEPSAAAQPAFVVEAKRRFLPWAVAGALLLVAVAASLIAVRATQERSGLGDAPLLRFDADLGRDALVSSAYAASFTAISPDGAKLVYAVRGPNGKQMLAARLLSQPGGSPLSGTEDGFDPFFSPDGQWIGFFADGKLKKTSMNGSAPVTLCDAAVFSRGASWGEDGTIIAALTNTAGLFRVPASGGVPQQLTQTRGAEATHRWPQVLPGGQSVLFTSSNSLSNYENADIEILNYKSGQRTVVHQGGYFGRYLASGHVVYVHEGVLFALPVAGSQLKPQGGPVPVLQDVASTTTSGAGQFDVSRNGVFVYRSGKAGPQIWSLVGLEESAGGSKMSPILVRPGAYYTPRFSPDGKRLALGIESENGVDISVYDLQNDVLSRLTFNGGTTAYPVWTPDGRHIAFYSRTGNRARIEWVRSDGAGGVQPLIGVFGRQLGNASAPYSLSPDSRRLAYYDQGPRSQFEIWILPLDLTDPDHPKPGEPERFAPSQANELHPALSPDGRWMAYTSDESGLYEVYVRPFPEPTAGGKWEISSGGGQAPVWSRDGKNLFFETLDNRIAVAGYTVKGDTFLASKPLIWSDKQIYKPTGDENFDVAPDGRRIAAMMAQLSIGESGGSEHVTFLLNFFNELRRRAPIGK
jgi:Tol biopolymer transport system component/tRNA A-37 threonylcarbamoyl transferase component Bud32